jgi:hypothetical protein
MTFFKRREPTCSITGDGYERWEICRVTYSRFGKPYPELIKAFTAEEEKALYLREENKTTTSKPRQFFFELARIRALAFYEKLVKSPPA